MVDIVENREIEKVHGGYIEDLGFDGTNYFDESGNFLFQEQPDVSGFGSLRFYPDSHFTGPKSLNLVVE